MAKQGGGRCGHAGDARLPACLPVCECRGQQTARVYVRNTRIADGKHHVIVDKVGGTPFSLASKSRQSLGVELTPPLPCWTCVQFAIYVGRRHVKNLLRPRCDTSPPPPPSCLPPWRLTLPPPSLCLPQERPDHEPAGPHGHLHGLQERACDGWRLPAERVRSTSLSLTPFCLAPPASW